MKPVSEAYRQRLREFTIDIHEAIFAAKLTLKQERWIHFFVGEAAGNATEAAKLAGYKGNRQQLTRVGNANKRNRKIQSVLAMYRKCRVMTADETLARISDIARGSLEDYITIDEDGGWEIDLPKAAEAGALQRLKELRYNVKTGQIAFQLESRLDALKLLAQVHGLLKETHQHEHRDVTFGAEDIVLAREKLAEFERELVAAEGRTVH